MKRKKIYVRLFITAVIVAALKIGVFGKWHSGGGSVLTMSDILNEGGAVEEIFSRLSPGEIFRLILVQMEVLEKKHNGSVMMKHFVFADDEDTPEVPYNPETLRYHYVDGDVIVIFGADLSLINTIRADLGLDAEDEEIAGQSGGSELYALACINSDVHTYVVPRHEAKTLREEFTMREFQIDRWARFLRWLGDMVTQALIDDEFASVHKLNTAAERKEI